MPAVDADCFTMKMINRYSFVLLSSAVLLCGFFELGLSREDSFHKMKFGGVHTCKGSQNSAEMESLARFAVQEHNKKEVFFFFNSFYV